MSMNTSEDIEFVISLQLFTIHCVSNQSPSKIKSYCNRLLSAVQNLRKMYIGQKLQLALAIESASLRNETRLRLNQHMNIISHLIYLCQPNFDLNEDQICKEWTDIDLVLLLNTSEQRFKQQSYSTTLWCQITNKISFVSIKKDSLQHYSFDFVQHDTDIHLLFQWIKEKSIQIPGRFNRTYRGIPLFWCTPISSSSSHNDSKYGSIRLIFSFSFVYSSIQHQIFDLRTRTNGKDIWNNILITNRKQIAGYGNDFIPLSSIPSSPVDIAIDLTDGPLTLNQVSITFVNHTDQCIPLLPQKLTSKDCCYHTSDSARIHFIQYLRKDQKFTLDQLKHFFQLEDFLKLKQIDEALSDQQINSRLHSIPIKLTDPIIFQVMPIPKDGLTPSELAITIRNFLLT